MHKIDLEYIHKIEKYCQKKNIKHIIVTHHSPLNSDLVNKKYSSLYYANIDLTKFKMVSHWIFGHTHINVDIKKNNIHFITNQYRNTNDYNIKKIINV
jgi:flavorubredoxin